MFDPKTIALIGATGKEGAVGRTILETTKSILIYMESVGNARKFMSAARAFARRNPIIILKPGRFAESARAAHSHTGAMAGDDAVYEAAFRRAGVIRVGEIAELFCCRRGS